MTFNERLNKNQKRRLDKIRVMTIFDTLTRLYDNNVDSNYDIWEDMRIIVRDKDTFISDNLYDLLGAVYTYVSKKNFDGFYNFMLKYVDNLDLYKFLIAVRNMSSKYMLSDYLYSLLAWVLSLIINLIVGNPITGINEATGEVFVDETSLCPVDLIAGPSMVVAIHEGYRPLFGLTEKDSRLVNDMCKLYNEEYLRTFASNIVTISYVRNQDDVTSAQDMIDYLLNIACSDQLMLLRSNKYQPIETSIGALWRLRDQNKALINNVDGFVEYVQEMDNIFLKRDMLLRENGVRFTLNGHFDDIVSIDVNEVHNFKSDTHYINFIAHYVDGVTRPLCLNIGQPLNNLSIHFETETSLLFFALIWLGLKDELMKVIDNLYNLKGNHLLFKEEDFEEIKEVYRNVVLGTEEALEASDIHYEDPKSWNYTGTTKYNKQKQYYGHKSHDGSYEYVIQDIGAYVRRLPVGQKASDEKIELARKYLIDLPMGYTLVDGFSRKQRVRAMF